MKPLSELVKEWQRQANTVGHPINEEQSNDFHFERGRLYCAIALEAWLREADKVLDKYEEDRKYLYPSQIRLHLLGTTRTEGKK